MSTFTDGLKARGWTDNRPDSDYAKGGWAILFDTSSWMIVSTESNPRAFDVHVPGEDESGWTVNLIEHLCRMEDERLRLRKALEGIRGMAGAGEAARSAAAEALAQCYHSWLVNVDVSEGQTGRLDCPICGQVAANGMPAERGAAPDPADM
jgi:hypothetical protein